MSASVIHVSMSVTAVTTTATRLEMHKVKYVRGQVHHRHVGVHCTRIMLSQSLELPTEPSALLGGLTMMEICLLCSG